MILLEDVNRLRREAALGLVESYEIAVPKAENMFKVVSLATSSSIKLVQK